MSRQQAFLSALEELDPVPLMWATYEIDLLAHWISTSEQSTHAVYQLVPIRVIACIEGCLKAATTELINSGDPYLGNARKLFQQIKIDFDVLRAVLDDRVSIGEIVAHSLGWHDIAEVNARMSALLGFEFFERLKEVEDRVETEIRRRPKGPIIASLDTVLADIGDALRIRHTLCHEISKPSVSVDDAKRFVNAGVAFTSAVSWLISETLNPNEPLTQFERNVRAGQRVEQAEDNVNEQVALLLQKLDEEDKALLLSSQEAWRAYRDAFSRLESNEAKGGTLAPTLYLQSAEAITRVRIRELQQCLRWEGLESKPKRRR